MRRSLSQARRCRRTPTTHRSTHNRGAFSTRTRSGTSVARRKLRAGRCGVVDGDTRTEAVTRESVGPTGAIPAATHPSTNSRRDAVWARIPCRHGRFSQRTNAIGRPSGSLSARVARIAPRGTGSERMSGDLFVIHDLIFAICHWPFVILAVMPATTGSALLTEAPSRSSTADQTNK